MSPTSHPTTWRLGLWSLVLLLGCQAAPDAVPEQTLEADGAELVDQVPSPVEVVELGALPDTLMLDQDGESVAFARDVVGDRLVAVNFIFTTCTMICPPMGLVFSKLRDEVPEDVGLVSVSIDPRTDTPERLSAWAAGFGEVEDWTLLTGDREEIEELLKELDVYEAARNEHKAVVLLGNGATGQWRRMDGLAPPEEMATALASLRP